MKIYDLTLTDQDGVVITSFKLGRDLPEDWFELDNNDVDGVFIDGDLDDSNEDGQEIMDEIKKLTQTKLETKKD